MEAPENAQNRQCKSFFLQNNHYIFKNYAAGPVCQANINKETIFSRAAFEPSKDEFNLEADNDDSMDVDDEVGSSKKSSKGKGKAGKTKGAKLLRRRSESDDDENDDHMNNFIVNDGEDEEEKDARHALKKRLGKMRANVIMDSDDELETSEEKGVIFGARKKDALEKDAVPTMSRFLPSTKMKVSNIVACCIFLH